VYGGEQSTVKVVKAALLMHQTSVSCVQVRGALDALATATTCRPWPATETDGGWQLTHYRGSARCTYPSV
jgi:hypothetical protein